MTCFFTTTQKFEKKSNFSYYIQHKKSYYQQNDLSDLHSPIWLAIYTAHIAELIHVNGNFLLLLIYTTAPSKVENERM